MKLSLLVISVLLCFGFQAHAEEEKSADKNVAALKVGDAAPNFKLKGTDGKTYQLSDFKGKSGVIVAWYPKALTGG